MSGSGRGGKYRGYPPTCNYYMRDSRTNYRDRADYEECHYDRTRSPGGRNRSRGDYDYHEESSDRVRYRERDNYYSGRNIGERNRDVNSDCEREIGGDSSDRRRGGVRRSERSISPGRRRDDGRSERSSKRNERQGDGGHSKRSFSRGRWRDDGRSQRSSKHNDRQRGNGQSERSFSHDQRGGDGRPERSSRNDAHRGGRYQFFTPLMPKRMTPTPDVVHVVPAAERKRRMIGRSTHGADLSTSRPRCFRISGVPLDWNDVELRDALQAIDSSLKDHSHQISLYPACYGSTQTALLTLDTCSEYFRNLKPSESYYAPAPAASTVLTLDSHFYDLTPLNTPEGDIFADVVAVPGLAGHAFESWRNYMTHKMWLKDFLPEHVKNIRIMTYGYDSSLIGDARSNARLIDHRRNFVQQLQNSRSSAENRPIIFIGHCLGCTLVLQTLVESIRNPDHKNILDSTHGIFFFGAPHQGLQTVELEVIVNSDEQRKNLIKQLEEGSEFLENQKEDLLRVWARFKRKVISFYENVDTRPVRKLKSSEFVIDGLEVQKVLRFSAQLFLPCELRLPVDKTHTEMVKFASQVDTTYQTVVKHMKEFVAQMHFIKVTPKVILSTIDAVDPDQFLHILSAVNQEKNKSPTSPFDPNQRKFDWIFRNMDFIEWNTTTHSEVLLVCGPPDCHIHKVSSHIVDEAKKNAFALYFFCSTVAMESSVETVFVHALLHQIICDLPPARKKLTIAVFFRTLVDAISSGEFSWYKEEDPLDEKIRTILNVTDPDCHWKALDAVLVNGRKQELFIIIDGLDKVQDRVPIYKFIARQHMRFSKVKAFITSTCHLWTEIPAIHCRITSIEYDKERKECLNSLRFCNTRYRKISEQHIGSLEWLWTHEQYKEWSASKNSRIFYIQGKPGSGKSTLAKYFKDSFAERNRNSIVASFFYSHRDSGLQTSHHSMLRAILYDILHQEESFFYHFQPEYRHNQKNGQPEWPYDSLKKVLASFQDHPRHERLTLILDAADESNHKGRRDILQFLFDICSNTKHFLVKIFISSRPMVEFEHFINQSYNSIRLEEETMSDIIMVTHATLQVPGLNLPDDLFLRAKNHIIKHSQGVFLWVHLIGKELLTYAATGCSNKEIFELLISLPTKLEDLYEQILEKLEQGNERDIRDGVRMFQFVVFACRPLTIPELHHALAILTYPDDEFIPSDELLEEATINGIEKRIMHCGGSILEIKNSQDNDSIQIMHQTVRDFFLRSTRSVFKMSDADSHVRISITCIRYLILFANKSGFPKIESWNSEHFEEYARYVSKRPLLNYTLSYLKDHMRFCLQDSNISRFVTRLLEILIDNPAFYLLGSWVTTHLGREVRSSASGTAGNFKNRLLYVAVRMNLLHATEAILMAGTQVDARLQGKTPLIVAAESGGESTVRLLVEWNAEKESKDDDKLTALHFASMNGHESIVKLLVETLGAYQDPRDTGRRTPLHLASMSGRDSIVRLLVQTLGADRGAKDGDRRMPLHLAAMQGHDSAVQLLVDTLGANKEAKDIDGQTPLHLATINGHNSTILLLVQTLGANKEARVGVGSYNSARRLLAQTLCADKETDQDSRWAPQHRAAMNGLNSTIRLLAETLGTDDYGHHNRTPLHLAAINGHNSIVRLLVKTLGADKEARDHMIWTPLHLAAAYGHDTTVQLLIETFGANKEAKDGVDFVPLHLAALYCRDTTVRLLIETLGADREAKDNTGYTPLHLAAMRGHNSIVELLIETLGVNKEARDIIGRTPLHLAAMNGQDSTVRLVKDLGIDMEAKDADMRTPLLLAAMHGHNSTVQLLVETLGANKKARDTVGRAPLHLAAMNGQNSTIRLIKALGTEMEAMDNDMRTPLLLAAMHGHSSTVGLLAALGANKNARDTDGRTSLHLAAMNNHDSTVELLVGALSANKEATDTSGRTPLHLAAINGHDSMIGLLVGALGAIKEARDTGGRTSLHLAAMNGHDSTVWLLQQNTTNPTYISATHLILSL